MIQKADLEPPSTYAEWLDLLDYTVQNPRDAGALEALSLGSYESSAKQTTRLVERIVEFENSALGSLLSGLQRRLALLTCQGSTEDAATILWRFFSECEALMFFEGSTWLPAKQLGELKKAVAGEVTRILGEVECHLRRAGSETCDSGLEDCLYITSRIKRTWAFGGANG